ncbi:MAG: TolC family protein [Acidobacteria bacterium]|nr:TolC family protein [Acidobacteriota bacterium]
MKAPLRQVVVRSLLIGVVVAAPGLARAQSTSDYAAELARIAMERAQASGQAAQQPAMTLTLDQAVKMALEHNLDIAVEALNPRTFDFSIAALESGYRPTLTSNFTNGDRITLPNSQLTGVTDKLETKSVGWSSGMTQSFRRSGGSLTVGFNNQRLDSSNLFATRNPSYTSSISASFVQPLLRGFKIDGARAQLQVTRINQEISEVQLRATITNTLANVRNAYWDLVYANQAVDVARRSLDLADKLVEDNKIRVEIGTMAPIDVVQAEAEAANRRLSLAQVEATLRTSELVLKRLLVNGTDDVVWRSTIDPVDRPTFKPEPVDVTAAVRAALDKRTDLAQAHKQLATNDINLRQLVNLTLPALDVTASYGLTGLGGTQFARSGLGGAVTRVVPGGYGDALGNLKGLDAPNWNIALNLSYPIGASAADANLARARLQQQQTQAQLKQLELQVATEVTNAALQVQNTLRRVEAATAARELSQRRLEAEQSKFEVGMTTNFFVVQAQRDLSDAQNTELRAQLDYRKSLVDFERVQETSLSRAGITVVSGGGGTTGSGATGGRTGGTGGPGGTGGGGGGGGS